LPIGGAKELRIDRPAPPLVQEVAGAGGEPAYDAGEQA
jgi:hypothetical protein